jgi:hypothetical protein
VGGVVQGKGKKNCVRLEVICDDFLYISHINFGPPGARNDLNILNSSDHFNRIRTGRWPSTRPEKIIGTLPLTWYYYLADGINLCAAYSSRLSPTLAHTRKRRFPDSRRRCGWESSAYST